MIGGQFKPYGSGGTPKPNTAEGACEIGAQMLRVATDYDAHIQSGLSRQETLEKMESQSKEYNPNLLAILQVCSAMTLNNQRHYDTKQINADDLTTEMIADEDITTQAGVLLVSKGSEITKALMERLRNYARSVGVREPFSVLVPKHEQSEAA